MIPLSPDDSTLPQISPLSSEPVHSSRGEWSGSEESGLIRGRRE